MQTRTYKFQLLKCHARASDLRLAILVPLQQPTVIHSRVGHGCVLDANEVRFTFTDPTGSYPMFGGTFEKCAGSGAGIIC